MHEIQNSKTSCIKEKFQIQIQTRQTAFPIVPKLKSLISNSKGESSMQNGSIDIEQLVSAHVIPVKMDMEQGSSNCCMIIGLMQSEKTFLMSTPKHPGVQIFR